MQLQEYPSRFIVPYMEWFLNSTDAPQSFGMASALMCLSTIALKHRRLGSANHVNSNIYMMVVGPSSKARKSTTVRRAREMVNLVWPQRIGPNDYTMEALFRWMNERDEKTGEDHSAVTLFASEFTADLARSAGYNNSFRDDLTNIYDGDDVTKIRVGMGKSVQVKQPRVNVFGAIAYDGLARNVTSNDWYSGFLMRFLYLAPTEYREILVRDPPDDPQRKYIAANALQHIAKAVYEQPKDLNIDEDAYAMYEEAFRNHEAYAEAHDKKRGIQQDEPITTTYLHRFWPNVRKLALLYQLDIDPLADVSVTAMQLALTFAAGCWQSFTVAHRRTTSGDYDTLCQMVMDKLREVGAKGIATSELGAIFGYSQQLGFVMSTLKATDSVREELHRGRKYLFLQSKAAAL